MGVLSDQEIEEFVESGFVLVEGAFTRAVADRCRALLWEATGCDPDDRSTWTRPVVRIPGLGDPPFRAAATTDRLHGAFDQLVGPGRWLPRDGLGSFPIRFPHPDPPGDDGWHIDAGWHEAEDDPDFDGDYTALSSDGFRVNLASRGRALLMLFLFSDVGADDAPTRIAVGSHLRVPPLLEPHDDAGTDGSVLPRLDDLEIVEATGLAGDVYLCHPFLVHAAQAHRGTEPKFMAQPPLYPAEGQLRIDDAEVGDTPVVRAIHLALGRI